jgi:hypothetical protein
MNENFVEMLAVGGKSNSLGRAGEVVKLVLGDRSRLDELYDYLLAAFTRDSSFSVAEMILLLKIQQQHKSNAVIKRANKLLTELSVE